ncbi:MAG: UDP-2-acetamido-2,6-beta-L-arabino-hexul-4-ose reductase [Pontibacterium sp.]
MNSRFAKGNRDLTQSLCASVQQVGRHIPIVYTSSIQAERDNDYGVSKLEAEQALKSLANETGNPVYLYRLPNVFGKWAKPNYNSAVATFCHNIARDLPIEIHDPQAEIRLAYVDDVVESFIRLLSNDSAQQPSPIQFVDIEPEYTISVGQLAHQLNTFKQSRNTLISEPVGTGLVRALYSTYLSYLPASDFSYTVPQYGDERGVFVEMLKTPNAGQFSFFTAHPGITRGGHYHHTKTEKFLVIKGKASFKFRHMQSGEFYEIVTSAEKSEIVETVPGWTHDVTNIGDDELICMLWANEIFDRDKPDTFTSAVAPS